MWSWRWSPHSTSIITSRWVAPVHFVLCRKSAESFFTLQTLSSRWFSWQNSSPHSCSPLPLRHWCLAWQSCHRRTAGGVTGCWYCSNELETIHPSGVPRCFSVTWWGTGPEVEKSGHHDVVHLHQTELLAERLLTVSDPSRPTLFSWKFLILCLYHPPLHLGQFDSRIKYWVYFWLTQSWYCGLMSDSWWCFLRKSYLYLFLHKIIFLYQYIGNVL